MIYQAEIPAKGIKKDLQSPVYQRLILPAGRHDLRVRMRDNIHDEGFTYTAEKTVALAPSQILVIDFDGVTRKFTFQ
jgi:hypothetical protein